MSKNVLLVVSNLSKLSKTFSEVKIHVPNILYIHLLNKSPQRSSSGPNFSKIVSKLYASSLQHSEDDVWDVRVFLSNLKVANQKTTFSKQIDVLIYDNELSTGDRIELEERYKNVRKVVTLDSTGDLNDLVCPDESEEKPYDNVVLGGTFDRIHTGHKLLLSDAVLRTNKRLVIGVTDTNMLLTKKLPELIYPVDERMEHLRDFLVDIDDTVDYEIVVIQDPFGPTKSDPNLDMIVVSEETVRGGQKVNEIRIQNNLKPLDIHVVKLIELNSNNAEKEIKISSSNKRMDMLGVRLREPEPKPHLPSRPYVIGLVGGIGSGKSVMSRRLEKMGAKVIDCDKVAHKIYEPGQKCYDELIEKFGHKIIGDSGEINRKKLGDIVFADKTKLDSLNQIVWPRLLEAVKQIIKDSADYEVVVMEAAVLLRAGWQSECHEVWSCIVPKDEAIKRVMERNSLSEEEARSRVNAQVDNETYVKQSHIVFSSAWSYEYSQVQAERAWKELMKTVQNKTKL